MAALSEVGGHKAPCLDGFPKGLLAYHEKRGNGVFEGTSS